MVALGCNLRASAELRDHVVASSVNDSSTAVAYGKDVVAATAVYLRDTVVERCDVVEVPGCGRGAVVAG